LRVQKGKPLSLTQCISTEKEKEEMPTIPYASTIGPIKYALMSTRPDVALAQLDEPVPKQPRYDSLERNQEYLEVP
jgi:hypothetical protein